MRLYSYIVARDYGFAPNPFFGVCTLATCKPRIRKTAQVGDWVVGTGSKKNGLDGHLVYAMVVEETLTFDEYWEDPRFRQKKPNLHGSLKQAYGDNIYHRDPSTGEWLQADSHHSFKGGRPNQWNIDHDTKTPRVLVGFGFKYWGATGPKIPGRFREYQGHDVCCSTQGEKSGFPEKLVKSFVEWIQSHHETGYIGDPRDFGK